VSRFGQLWVGDALLVESGEHVLPPHKRKPFAHAVDLYLDLGTSGGVILYNGGQDAVQNQQRAADSVNQFALVGGFPGMEHGEVGAQEGMVVRDELDWDVAVDPGCLERNDETLKHREQLLSTRLRATQ
jgi:hypothetical protein